MKANENIFINILSSYLNNCDLTDVDINDINWETINHFAEIHNLSGMLYAALKDKNICNDNSLMKKLNDYFILTVQNSVVQEYTLNNLVNIFNKHKIKHILFKGTILKNYYPTKELRSMGDIDIFVNENDINTVHNLLLKNGFIYDELHSHSKVRNYEKNKVCFEIHIQLISKNFIENVDFINYFSNCFGYVKNLSEYTFEFEYEYHLIYLFVHLAKHFKFGGCGVRMIMDIAIFVKKLSAKIDWHYLGKELKKLQIDKFAQTILLICEKWFEIPLPPDFDFVGNESDIDRIMCYILAGGVFGYNDKNIDAINTYQKKISFFEKIKGIFRLVFPSYEKLRERYVWFEKYPKWLLPIGWVKFWCYRLFGTDENNFKRVVSIWKDDEDAVKHREILDLIGLNKR